MCKYCNLYNSGVMESNFLKALIICMIDYYSTWLLIGTWGQEEDGWIKAANNFTRTSISWAKCLLI